MSKSLRLVAAIGTATLIVLAACSSKEAATPSAGAAAPAEEAAAPAPAAITAEASVIDLMKDTIAPTADILWGAVGSESTAAGTRDLAPSTDAEWAALREKAQLLVDAARAAADGRVLAHPGQKLKDPPGEGDLSPEQAQAAITKDRAVFVAFAESLQAVGGEYLAAIDKKNVETFTEVGGKLDEVCETCHTRFWYPNAPKPPGL